MHTSFPSSPPSKCHCVARLALAIAFMSAATVLAAEAANPRFDIAAGAAEPALKQFSAQSGRQVIAPTNLLQGVRTQTIKGDLSAQAALDLMLARTGLAARLDDASGAFAIVRVDREATPAPKAVAARANSSPAARAGQTTAEGAAIELSPFVVSTDKDVGYLAANTLAGSRLNSSLYDTPASISELTKEFLADINANSVNEAVEYSLGFEIDRPGGNENNTQFQAGSPNIVARGLGRARVVSRDYFPLNLDHDVFSMERISQSRGPNSILFGLGNAGGIINSASKVAFFKHAGELVLKVDDDGGWRSTLDYNRKLTDRLAVRVNLLKEDQRTWRDLEYVRSERVQLAGTWRPFQRTEVRAQFERGLQSRLRAYGFSGRDFFTAWLDAGSPAYDRVTQGNTYPTGVVAVATTPRLTMGDSGQITNLQRFGQSRGGAYIADTIKMWDERYLPFTAVLQGPASTTDNTLWLSSVIVQQEVVKNLFVELGYNEARQNRNVQPGINQGAIGLRLDPNKTLVNGAPNPNYGQFYVEGQSQISTQRFGWHNLRATVAYEWKSGNKWLGSHKWVGLGTSALDTFSSDVFLESNVTPLTPTGATRAYSNAQNTIWRRTYVSRNGVFGDGGIRSWQHDPFGTRPAPTAFTDPGNGLNGTITPGWWLNNWRIERNANQSAMLAGQSRVLFDRLVATYGWRKDTLDTQIQIVTRDPVTNVVTASTLGPVASFKGDTKTVGVVVPVTSWFAFYGNRSDNFSPQSALDLTRQQIGNLKGQGLDYGIKASWGGNLLYARAGIYESTTANQQEAVFTPNVRALQIWEAIEGTTGANYLRLDNTNGGQDTKDQVSKGYEIEVTANPLKGLSLTANYGKLEVVDDNLWPRTRAYVAQYHDLWARNAALTVPSSPDITVATALQAIDDAIEQARLRTGNRGKGVYSTSFNAFGRYQFQNDTLRGWGIGGGARFRNDRVVGFRTDRSPYFAPAQLLVDASLSYRRRILQNKVGLGLQLNVANLLDNTDIIWTSVTAAGVREDYTLQTPRKLTLSATFTF